MTEPMMPPPETPVPPAPFKWNRRRVVQIVSISLLTIAVLAILVSGYVYYQAVKTFEVRRVSLPTSIYTDIFRLNAGTVVDGGALRDKLQRLGFRETSQLTQPGDATYGKGTIDLFLRPFSHPSGDRQAQKVRLTLGASVIDNVTTPEGAALTDAALEPELLTSLLGDQLENRRPVTLSQVPQHLVDSVVVTEDLRFFQHPGVDPIGVTRAAFRNVKAKGVSEGGSTLTQQLVKNYYLTNERTMRRKIVEAFMSLILDARYSKKEILEAYLNDIYLGRNRSISILGVGEATRFYFGKPINEITVSEAAIIAGMVRSPNNNSPFAHPARSLERRNTVLGLLLKNKKIDQATYQKAMAEKLPTKPFRERAGLSSIPFYVDRVLQELKLDYGIDDVQGRGLSIYTAIDLDWQDQAAKTLESGLRGLEKSNRDLRRAKNPLEGVMMAVDVPTGEIRALVGGRNYDRSQFNRALNAKRQVGSLFKPFVFLAAFEPSLSNQNITPATLVNDNRFVLERRYSKDWSPRNYGDHYNGVVTVRRALEQSMNVASVRIGLSTGVDAAIKAAHVLGVQQELEDVPSLILGSVEIPPIEMAEAYSTLARMGARAPLRTIRYVTNEGGKVVASGDEVKAVQVFPARDVFLTVHIMEGVVNRGTAAVARSLGVKGPVAGKTGTTNDKRDAWFIGFTPQTLALTWIGFDDNSPVGVSGAEGAVPIWSRYMREIQKGQPLQDFPAPSGIIFTQVDANSGGLATPQCPPAMVVNEAFKQGTQPMGLCPLHSPGLQPLYPMPGTDPMATTTDLDPTILAPGQTATLSPTEPAPVQQQPVTTTSGEPLLGGGRFRRDDPPPEPPPPTEPPVTTTTEEPPPPSSE